MLEFAFQHATLCSEGDGMDKVVSGGAAPYSPQRQLQGGFSFPSNAEPAFASQSPAAGRKHADLTQIKLLWGLLLCPRNSLVQKSILFKRKSILRNRMFYLAMPESL